MAKPQFTADTLGAGAGVGTLLILFADRLDPSNIWKDIIIFSAPSITLISGWIWAMLKNQLFLLLSDYNYNRILANALSLVNSSKARGAKDAHVERLTTAIDDLEAARMATYRARSNIEFAPDKPLERDKPT